MNNVLQEYVELSNRHNYLSPTKFLFSSSIFEYDIRQANINVLRAFGRLSDKDYHRLSIADKRSREIEIGNWIANDSTVYETIQNGIKKAKLGLLTSNKVSPTDVLRIANDAVYVISPHPLRYTKFTINESSDCTVEFVAKNRFTSYLSLGDVIVLINSDGEGWDIDIKGISDDLIPLHEAFISTICNLVQSREMGGVDMAAREFNNFFQEYVNLVLPIEYYREFNSVSGYRVKGAPFILLQAPPLEHVDIGYNLRLLRSLYAYLISK